MRFDRLMWLFAGLFLLIGLPLFFVEDVAWVRPLISLCVLSLGCFGLSMAADGMAKGTIRLQFSHIRRAAQPAAFWSAIALVAVAGVGSVITAAWAYFFKVW